MHWLCAVSFILFLTANHIAQFNYNNFEVFISFDATKFVVDLAFNISQNTNKPGTTMRRTRAYRRHRGRWLYRSFRTSCRNLKERKIRGTDSALRNKSERNVGHGRLMPGAARRTIVWELCPAYTGISAVIWSICIFSWCCWVQQGFGRLPMRLGNYAKSLQKACTEPAKRKIILYSWAMKSIKWGISPTNIGYSNANIPCSM